MKNKESILEMLQKQNRTKEIYKWPILILAILIFLFSAFIFYIYYKYFMQVLDGNSTNMLEEKTLLLSVLQLLPIAGIMHLFTSFFLFNKFFNILFKGIEYDALIYLLKKDELRVKGADQ
jgi:hypothetical protein